MHGMRNVAQGVEDEIVEAFEERHRRIGHGAEVRKIGSAAEAEAENIHIAVKQRHGDERNAEQFERAIDHIKRYARNRTERWLIVEDVREDSPDDSESVLVAVNRERRALPDV